MITLFMLLLVWAMKKREKRCMPKEGMPHAQKTCQKYKRCIPKEGMPHAHKACQKKCIAHVHEK